MGIGNLIGMPLAYAVGRRSVLLLAIIVLIVSACMCAIAPDYDFHLAWRCVLGLGAGQSEALVPLMTQEIFFLHERGRALMWQQTVQVIIGAIWVLFAGPIAGQIGSDWWYNLGAILAGVVLVRGRTMTSLSSKVLASIIPPLRMAALRVLVVATEGSSPCASGS